MIDPRHPLAVLAMSRMGRCDASPLGRFRTGIGKARVEELLKATVDVAVMRKAVRPPEFQPVIVVSTVQETAIAFPVDRHFLEIARHKVVQAATRRVSSCTSRAGGHPPEGDPRS